MDIALLLAVIFVGWLAPRVACGQAGLRESLERLDVNQNGWIEPSEVTPLSRPYLERIARTRRMRLDEPHRIEAFQDAARRHYAQQNGASGRDIESDGEGTVRSFGPDRDEPLIPEFGLVEVNYPYTQADLDFADRTMRSHDWNRDGYIDREEARYNRWTHRDPFADDLDKDDRLSRLELAQRYARRRLLDDASNELRLREWRLESGREDRRDDRRDRDEGWRWSRRGGIDYWLTQSLMDRFDENQNGRLEMEEAESVGLPSAQIDADRDGDLSRDELFAYLSVIQDELTEYTEGLPGWFYELDANEDSQVEMSEYVTEWTEEKLDEFRSLDANDDGLITADELASSIANVGGSYRNTVAEVLPPSKTIISEIEVRDDFRIRDLDVQISITHTSIGQIDAFLTGPEGQRIELFAGGVGGSEDHYEQTIFDDQAREPINKSRHPYRGRYRPSGTEKRQPGLSTYNGTNAQGVWQLVIRGTRNERFGMLHSWSLIVKPEEE